MVHGVLEEDLLEALKELLVSSEALASGETPSVEECNRYDVAVVDRLRKLTRNRRPV